MPLKEVGVITMVCCQNEPWTTSVTRCCQQVFNLCDADISQIIQSYHQEADEAFMYESEEFAPSVCWRHKATCRDLPLHYDALRVKA
mmetsp:Transcript_11111/g.34882  ORF Transcript_11111/g.34882 Transcript_11111/m.34882 type:complete len:87 (-) Transcript_11111:366-626(-)